MSFVKIDPDATINISTRNSQFVRVVLQYSHFRDQSIAMIDIDKNNFRVLKTEVCAEVSNNCKLW